MKTKFIFAFLMGISFSQALAESIGVIERSALKGSLQHIYFKCWRGTDKLANQADRDAAYAWCKAGYDIARKRRDKKYMTKFKPMIKTNPSKKEKAHARKIRKKLRRNRVL